VARSKLALETFSVGSNLRWDVRWVAKLKDKQWHVIVKDFGTDLPGAIEFLQKVKTSGGKRHYITLRCRNSGFAPPEKLQPYWGVKKVKKQVRRRGKLKTVLTYEDVYRVPMKRRNREGVWWCPYCMELREFVRAHELPYEPPKAIIDLMPQNGGMYCPMCFVGTSDHNVRKWNPLAERISY
jgi:hypothetical protein